MKRIRTASAAAISLRIISGLFFVAAIVVFFATSLNQISKSENKEEFLKTHLGILWAFAGIFWMSIILGILGYVLTILAIDRAYKRNEVARIIGIIGVIIIPLYILSFVALCIICAKNSVANEEEEKEALTRTEAQKIAQVNQNAYMMYQNNMNNQGQLNQNSDPTQNKEI
ncbi:hypothetical protein [Metamycoplasma neophronis]|uniref:DUF4064 domain-containing protein n=1 Tax=Metamycoplasma neophronis TaxID=872983 RepID=A0ABY2Z3N2_9BACT|nr:hypothetical protein [Metamycoplasma neophronis]TPR53525.1 hypothetical protein FJR74_02400 [Metamycoplasma neophronis]